MKYINNNIFYISIIYIFLFFSKLVKSEDKIRILLERPNSNILNNLNLEKYSTIINENLLYPNTRIEFSYPPENITKYEDYTKYVVEQLKLKEKSIYDMFILDDKFLFGEVEKLESQYLINVFHERKYHKYYMDLTSDNKKSSQESNDEKIVKDGYLNDHIYGLPYEIDFDVLYHDNDIIELIKDKSNWDDLYLSLNQKIENSSQEEVPFGIAFGDDDELLNFFIEYVLTKYNIAGNYRKYFDIFYKDKSKELFVSFHNIVKSQLKINQDLKMTIENAYQSYINGESCIFKGKISSFQSIINQDIINNQNQTIVVSLPPGDNSVILKKYLVVNKNRNIDKKILKDIAYKLTSEEMQLVRAENFGSIPTFDINKKNVNSNIGSYCQNFTEICQLIGEMKKIHIKEVFKNKNSPPFMEVRLLLPEALRNFLSSGDLDTISFILENVQHLFIDNTKNSTVLLIVLYTEIYTFTLVSVIIMFMVYYYRNHPYLKRYSPELCILLIIGYTMGVLSPLLFGHITSAAQCSFNFIFNTFNSYIIEITMFIVTYRIYTIFSNNSKINFGSKLNNKHLLIFDFVAIILLAIPNMIILYFHNYTIIASGNIKTYRNAVCKFDDEGEYHLFTRYFGRTLYVLMIFLVVRTGSISKHYDEYYYIYSFTLILGIEAILEYVNDFFSFQNRIVIQQIVDIIYTLVYFLCTYLLIVPKLIKIYKYPLDSSDTSNNDKSISDYNNNPTDITRFIFLDSNINKNQHKWLFKKNNTTQNTSTTTEEDMIDNNPNNIFFNKKLQSLNNEMSTSINATC